MFLSTQIEVSLPKLITGKLSRDKFIVSLPIHPLPFVTRTLYCPAVLTVIALVVALLLHK